MIHSVYGLIMNQWLADGVPWQQRSRSECFCCTVSSSLTQTEQFSAAGGLMRLHLWIVGLVVGPLLLPVITGPMAAQADSGSRVRVTTSAGAQRRWVGTLVQVDTDSIRLTSARDRKIVSLPTASVVRVERSVDRRTNAGGGALIGALVGGGAGLVLGILASSEEDSWYEVGAGDVLAATAFLAAIGGGVGALIGAVSHKERWEPTPLQAQSSRPVRARLGLVLRF
jgi:hypothetical protein